MSTFDVYGMTDRIDTTIADAIVARLEARGNNPFFQRMMNDYLDAMHIDSTNAVLDLGCGTGVASRGIARRPGFTGTVTGIDLSPYLVEVAKRLAAEDGVSERITFRSGDTRSLDLDDESFDAVIAHTLLSHVDNPFAVLQEAARIVRRGGLIGMGSFSAPAISMATLPGVRKHAAFFSRLFRRNLNLTPAWTFSTMRLMLFFDGR